MQLDVNQVISPTLAIRAGGLFQDANVAGRNFVTDDRNGGFVAATYKPVDAVKITGNYIHTELTGIPDFGVPYYRPSTATTAGGPFPEFGVNRNNFYGFVNRDFFRTGQDIGTINAEVQITPDLMLSNKTRESRSTQNYVGTLPESPTLAAGAPFGAYTLTANPQSRLQVTDVFANQTEATYKFGDAAGFNHTLLGGVEIDRESSSIDSYTGLRSELTTGPVAFNGTGSLAGVSVFGPQYTETPFPNGLALNGRPTNIKIDTNSGYLIDTANYHDLLILNGGIRYDDYTVRTAGFGTVGGVSTYGSQSADFGLPNYNLGVTLKPQPNGSVYVAYATSANPVGAEFDGTSTAYGGLSPVLNGANTQIYGPEKNKAIEIGTKWELFDRHLLVIGCAVPDQQGQRARGAECRHPRRGGPGSRMFVSCRHDGQCVLHHRGRGLSDPRHRPRRHRQDHRPMERVRRPGADGVGSHEVAGAFGRPDPLSDQYRTSACQRRASVVQHAQQISADRYVGAWRAGGVPLQDLWRHAAGGQPGHRTAELLALRCLRGSQAEPELAREAVRQQHLQQALLRRPVSKRGTVRAGSTWPHRGAGGLGKVLIAMRC